MLATSIIGTSAFAEKVAVYNMDPETGLHDPNYTIEERPDEPETTAIIESFRFSQTINPSRYTASENLDDNDGQDTTVYTMSTNNILVINIDSYTRGNPFYFTLTNVATGQDLTNGGAQIVLPRTEINLLTPLLSYEVCMKSTGFSSTVTGSISDTE